jgi:hypothetical protein
MWFQRYKCQGKWITTELPKGYVVMKQDRKTQLEKMAEVLSELKSLFQRGKYHGGTEYSNTILTVGLAAAPTIPLTTLAEVMPVLTMGAHIEDSGLPNQNNFDMEKCVKSSPSGTFMREKLHHTATMCIMQMADEMDGKPVHLAVDKGMLHML